MMIERPDILIAGAGYVGLSAAVAIKQAKPDLAVQVVDAAPDGVWEKDTRASAIAAAGRRMFARFGIWESLHREAQAISDMIVTDSRANDAVRPVFLTFDGEATPGEPFAHMVPNVAMNRELRRLARELGISVLQGRPAKAFETLDGKPAIRFADGTATRANLVIACDGVRSILRDTAGIKTVHFDYGQSGIVGTVAHEEPHHGRAEEHFLPAGPFAILPLPGNRSSIVWTERTSDADRLVQEDAFVFDYELERRFGHHLGKIKMETQPKAFPLALTLAREFVRPGLALAGDAAHGIHPIAGQGLNLGLKDVAALAETVVEAARLGQDIGALDVLQRYERWRRFDTVQMGVTTDILNRLFSNDLAPIRFARTFGLGLVDRMNPLKRFFIGQAAGLSKANPRLLNGEAI